MTLSKYFREIADDGTWTWVILRPRLVLDEEVEDAEELEVVDKVVVWRASGVATTDHRRDDEEEVGVELPLPPPPLVLRGLAMASA